MISPIMITGRILCLCAVGFLGIEPVTLASGPDPLSVVEKFNIAFNAHDPEKMLECVADDIEWLSVAGPAISVEAKGRSALQEAMQGYFASVPSARSEVESSMVTGVYVTVRERAFWRVGQKEKSQCSLAVYEVRSGKIRRVWYYPAEECTS